MTWLSSGNKVFTTSLVEEANALTTVPRCSEVEVRLTLL